MKTLFIALFAFTAAHANAGDNIVCALLDSADRSNYISVKADLADLGEEETIFNSEGSLDFAKDSFSFDLQITKVASNLEINVLFFENNNVQDEIGSAGWKIDLKKAKAGKPILREPLHYGGHKALMNFVCYYNKH